MKQPIAGVTPAQVAEATVMIVWPSTGKYVLGRFMGRILKIRWPDLLFIRLGVLVAPFFVPLALALYLYRLVPSFFGLSWHGTFYKLTNRRVLELRNEVRWVDGRVKFIYGAEIKSVQLDRFDAIDIVRRPGHEWFDCGDLIFRLGETETFRLEAVSRPESFRHTCLKARMAYVGVSKALQHSA
jgi:hypothetical protein